MNSTKRPLNPIIDLDSEMYCEIVNSLPKGCMQESILELYNFDALKLDRVKKYEIIEALNKTKFSPYSGHKKEFISLLGGIERDSNGKVISATSILSRYMLHVNYSEHDSNKLGNTAGTEDWTSEKIMLWEARFIKEMAKLKKQYETENFKIYYTAGRRYNFINLIKLFFLFNHY